MSSMHSITDNMGHYHRAFGVYHRAADRINVMNHWVDIELKQIVKEMEIKVTGKESMRVLSIGPGDGEIENGILRVIRDRKEPHDHVHTTVVEPAVDMVNKYKERVASESSQLRNMTYDWKTQTLDEYQGMAEHDANKFHFISTVHSIYYAENLQGSLRDLYNRLEPGGMMLIVVISDKSGAGQFARRFPLLWGARHHHPTSAEVQAACKKENIPISQDLTIKVRSNITACFSDPEDLVEDGRLLLDFFTHVANFVRDAPPKLRQEVVEFLGSDSCSERRDGGEVYLHADWKALVVRRQ